VKEAILTCQSASILHNTHLDDSRRHGCGQIVKKGRLLVPQSDSVRRLVLDVLSVDGIMRCWGHCTASVLSDVKYTTIKYLFGLLHGADLCFPEAGGHPLSA